MKTRTNVTTQSSPIASCGQSDRRRNAIETGGYNKMISGEINRLALNGKCGHWKQFSVKINYSTK